MILKHFSLKFKKFYKDTQKNFAILKMCEKF